MREFFKTKKDIEERIRNNVRNIAFYADNLTKKDCILVDSFLKSGEKNMILITIFVKLRISYMITQTFISLMFQKIIGLVGYLWSLPIYYCVTKYGSSIMDMTIIS